MYTFLSSSHGGQDVLRRFEKDGKLDKTARDALTTLLDRKLPKDYGAKTNNSHFEIVSKLIVELFPKECAV